MNIEYSKPSEWNPKPIEAMSKPIEAISKPTPKYMDHEYLKAPVRISKKINSLMEMWSK
jgi:hypothetical protein